MQITASNFDIELFLRSLSLKCEYMLIFKTCELTIFLYVHSYLHERHEQSKQDLKGLEETVVR